MKFTKKTLIACVVQRALLGSGLCATIDVDAGLMRGIDDIASAEDAAAVKDQFGKPRHTCKPCHDDFRNAN